MKTKIISILVFILVFIQVLTINAQEVIYYCSKSNTSGSAWQIYKQNLTSGKIDTITNNPAYNYWKVELSPNYKQLLMLRSPIGSLPDQENYENCEIVKSNADGTNQQVIVSDNENGWFAFGNPHWHPSGNRILMLAQTLNSSAPWYLYTIDTLGNAPKQLTTQWSIDPNWSPTGDKIAFVGITGSSLLDMEIFIADYDYPLNQLSNITQLTADSTRNHDPCFSPDGTVIAFAAYDSTIITNGDIVTISTTGANRTKLVDDNGVHGGVLNWGTDGKIYHDNIYLFVTNWYASRFNTLTKKEEILLSSTNYHYLHPYYANLDYTNLSTLTKPEQHIDVYPNPSNEIITIEIPNTFQNYVIEIYSPLGQQIFKASDQTVIDMSNFKNGIYILIVKQEDKIWTTKIIKY
ncbi:MAG: T9SS type A sorting domain-containing protein [Bacteroidia bacterium]|nr:T9SS type A sorting domain-containing protein [Bacteroidia bacterium]